jgi:hypothetical protein
LLPLWCGIFIFRFFSAPRSKKTSDKIELINLFKPRYFFRKEIKSIAVENLQQHELSNEERRHPSRSFYELDLGRVLHSLQKNALDFNSFLSSMAILASWNNH